MKSALLCAEGCGFFGTVENHNMCSKCYNDYLKQEISSKSKFSKSVDHTHESLSIKNATSVSVEDTSTKTGSSATNVKIRCECCNKKVDLAGFACRCGKVLCGKHRFFKEHSCSFDFKTADRQLLAKQNPLIKPDKLQNRLRNAQ